MTPLHLLRAENAVLRDRVQELLDAFGLRHVPLFPPAWRLTRMQARLLAVLASHKSYVHRQAIETVLYDRAGTRCRHTVMVFIFNARRKLAPHGIEIENSHGLGWRIAPHSREALRKAMAEAANG